MPASLCYLLLGQGADDYRDLHNQVVPAVFHRPGEDGFGLFAALLLACMVNLPVFIKSIII